MKSQNILYIFFTALILAYPLYEGKLVHEAYRQRILHYVYAPLALTCLLLTIWTLVSSDKESSLFSQRLIKQEGKTKALVAGSLKISSFEIRARYKFIYKNDLDTKIIMHKANPIAAYIVNTEVKKDSIAFTSDNPKIYYPNKHTVEFKFSFAPENPSDVYGKPLRFLEKFDSLYLPWQSFTHFLALLKLGGPVELSEDPHLDFQVLINGEVVIDQKEIIRDLDPDSVVLIFRTEPKLFKDIEKYFLDEMGIGKE
jgi:hypothetical protein